MFLLHVSVIRIEMHGETVNIASEQLHFQLSDIYLQLLRLHCDMRTRR